METHESPNAEASQSGALFTEASESNAMFHNGDTKVPTSRPPSQVPCLLRPPRQVLTFTMETDGLFDNGDTRG